MRRVDGLIALVLLLLCGIVFAIDRSADPFTPVRRWTSMICAGLGWLLMFLFVLLPAALFVLAKLAGF